MCFYSGGTWVISNVCQWATNVFLCKSVWASCRQLSPDTSNNSIHWCQRRFDRWRTFRLSRREISWYDSWYDSLEGKDSLSWYKIIQRKTENEVYYYFFANLFFLSLLLFNLSLLFLYLILFVCFKNFWTGKPWRWYKFPRFGLLCLRQRRWRPRNSTNQAFLQTVKKKFYIFPESNNRRIKFLFSFLFLLKMLVNILKN